MPSAVSAPHPWTYPLPGSLVILSPEVRCCATCSAARRRSTPPRSPSSTRRLRATEPSTRPPPIGRSPPATCWPLTRSRCSPRPVEPPETDPEFHAACVTLTLTTAPPSPVHLGIGLCRCDTARDHAEVPPGMFGRAAR